MELTDAFSSVGERGGADGEGGKGGDGGGGDGGGGESSGEVGGGGAVASLEGLGQMQQLLNPSTLNMATLRAACLPGFGTAGG